MDLQAPPPSPIKDGTEATFMADVIEASAEVPVIVDFWAPWCGPCKTLTPALEKAVTEAKGKVRLVKIDVDQNQRIAAQMRVQSIPAVFGFVGGQPVDGFMGAQSPAQIKAFVDRLIEMSGGNAGIEEAIAAAEEMLAEGAAADAAQTFAAILQRGGGQRRRARRAGALLSRARRHRSGRGRAGADAEGQGVRPGDRGGAGADRARRGQRPAPARPASSSAALARDPDDHQARFDLAMAQVGKGDSEGAIDTLLELFRRDREWNDGAAKAQLFKLFDSLGPKSEAAQKGRRRLSSMIFA